MLWEKRSFLYLMFLCLLIQGCGTHDTSPKALIEKRCYRCHTPDRIYAARKDAAGWRITVQKMATYASGVIREEEIPIIIDYLARTQGIDKAGEKPSSGEVGKRR